MEVIFGSLALTFLSHRRHASAILTEAGGDANHRGIWRLEEWSKHIRGRVRTARNVSP